MGWGQIAGNGGAVVSETVTFDEEFSATPVIIMSLVGKDSTPPATVIDDLSETTAAIYVPRALSPTASNFSAEIRIEGGASLNASHNYGYFWLAIGAV